MKLGTKIGQLGQMNSPIPPLYTIVDTIQEL